MFDLSGKRALVTGASGGIGSAIAKALATQGAEVALSGTRVGALEDVAKDIIGKNHILPCNLADPDSVERLVPQAEEAMGGIDILVNNAGMTRDNLFMRMKDEEWDDVLKINLTAPFHLTRSAIKGMMKRRFGRIVSITSPKFGGSVGRSPAKTAARSRKSQGRPRQPRPTTTPSQSVARIMRSASQASQMSPLPKTGIEPTACLSSPIAFQSASPS